MLTVIWNIFLYFSLFIIIVLLFFRFWIKTLAVPCKSYTCMVGKTVIITGANTGIGYYTALDLAKRGANVILACRDQAKANFAKSSIIKATGNHNITVKLVNFHSLQSVRNFAKDINETVEKLDVLVNNAGAGGMKSRMTEDGLDITWQTNYFAPFLLTNLLVDKLRKSAPSRVVNVASLLAKKSDIDLDTVNKYHKYMVYSWTKQAKILFARELARRVEGTGIMVYSLHPGAIYTDIWRRVPKWVLGIFIPIMKFIYKTPEEGAQTTIHCAVSMECQQENGKLYQECSTIKMYDSCTNMKFAKSLWEKSAELVKLESHEYNIG